ncbi:hypothetical protein ACEYYA_02440 [Paracoccus sp. p3-h83]|uniref:hypothetical protein n=1 Tax=Paracoccus sp. p3-h83 TaxID=3342805 RepID=UPI0035B80BE6
MVDRHHPGKAPTVLLAALADGSCRTIDQLIEPLDLTRRQVADAAACLLRRDYLMRMGAGCYQLTEAGIAAHAAGETITSGPRGPRATPRKIREGIRIRAWRSMRMRQWFTIPDLITDAARPEDRSPSDNLHRYLRALRQAGYVKVAARRAPGSAQTSNGFKYFVLVKNTGPQAPIMLSKIAAIHDPNIGKDVPCVRP